MKDLVHSSQCIISEKIQSIFLQLTSLTCLAYTFRGGKHVFLCLFYFLLEYLKSQFYENTYNGQTTRRSSETFQRLLKYFFHFILAAAGKVRARSPCEPPNGPMNIMADPCDTTKVGKKRRMWLVGHSCGSNGWSQSAFGNISQMAADRGGGTNTWPRLLLQSLLRGSRQCRRCLLWQIAREEVCLNKDACNLTLVFKMEKKCSVCLGEKIRKWKIQLTTTYI